MPCDQVRTITIDFGKASKSVLKSAIEGMGHAVKETARGLAFYDKSGTYLGAWIEGGNLGLRYSGGANLREDEIRTAYSGAAIAATSKKFAQWQTIKKSENKYVLRRAF